MRRTFSTLLLTLATLVLAALPAFATETAAEVVEPGKFDGLIKTAIVGIVIGAVMFFDAYAMGPHVEDDGHH